MTDPFAVLGLEPSMSLSKADLDDRYLELSRNTHPDRHGNDAGVLQRSAEVNDAYRTLRDPWRRAEALVERADAGAMERTKSLDPSFLMAAMELAEDVSNAGPAEFTTLRDAIEPRVAEYLSRIEGALDDGDVDAAATALHEAKYYRKALHDLDAREEHA